jgi:hypothetical protein
VRTVPRLCEVYPDICLTTEEKARKNISQGKKILSQGKKNLSRSTIYILPKHPHIILYKHLILSRSFMDLVSVWRLLSCLQKVTVTLIVALVLCACVVLLLPPTNFLLRLQWLSYPVICRGIDRKVKLSRCGLKGVWRNIGTALLILRFDTGWT